MNPTVEITYRDGTRVMHVMLDVASPQRIVERLQAMGAQTVEITALSQREREVARLVSQGWNNKLIARELGISEGTVKRHVSNILEKEGLESRTQLALGMARPSLGLAIA